MEPAWIAAIVTVAIAIIGALVVLAGRLSRMETKVEEHDREIHSLRERWHDLRDNTMKKAWDLFEEWKDDMARKFTRKDE